jgi:hypothetical protein
VLRVLKNSENILTVTLTEKSTLPNPIYLFKFINQTSNVAYWFISFDTSQFKQRYNQFLMIEQADAMPPQTLDGIIELGLEGRYDYEIYQTTLTDTATLTRAIDAIPFIDKTVEVGLVDVVFESEILTEYEVESETNIVYQPE